MLSQDQIRPFIVHPVQIVRDFAAGYFHNHNHQPDDLMEWVIRALSSYDPSECIRLLTASQEFRINADQLDTLLDMHSGIPATKENVLLRKHLEWSLLRGSADFLRGSAEVLLGKRNLTSTNRRIISRFAKLPRIDTNTLLEELNRTARSPRILIEIDNEDYFYGTFLGYQLGLIVNEPTFEEIVKVCVNRGTYASWQSILLHEAIRSAPFPVDLVPFLRFLRSEGDPMGPEEVVVNSVIYTAAARADHEFVKEMFRRFPGASFLFILRCLEAAVTVKHGSVADLCLGCLQRTKDLSHRAYLYRILAGLLWADSLPILERASEKRDFSPDFFGLDESLAVLKVIMSGDHAGVSKHSKKAATISALHEAQEKQLREYMLGFDTAE